MIRLLLGAHAALSIACTPEFVPPPAAPDADAAAPTFDVLEPLPCVCQTGDGCVGEGAPHPEAACEVCAPDGAFIACPFACADGVCQQAIDVSCGDHHGCVLLQDGAVWCWGAQGHAQLGTGQAIGTQTWPPAPVVGLPAAPVRQLMAGFRFTCVVVEGDEQWCWGNDRSGQLTDGPESLVEAPLKLDNPPTAAMLKARESTNCILTSGGEVWCRGHYVPDSPKLRDAGTLVQIPEVSADDEVVGGFARGFGNGCVIDQGGGRARCWGLHKTGQLGNSSEVERSEVPLEVELPAGFQIAALAPGCALEAGGELWCWGLNRDDWLGLGAEVEFTRTPVLVPDLPPFSELYRGRSICGVVTGSREVHCFGDNARGAAGAPAAVATVSQPIKLAVPAAAAQVAGSSQFMCARTLGGFVYCWGSNQEGQLGWGTTDVDPHPEPSLVTKAP